MDFARLGSFASPAPELNASASLSSSSSSLQNGANGALRDEVKRLSQRVDVLTSEKAVLTEQQAQLLGEAESQTMPTNLERESARTTMPTNLERESARTTLVQKQSPRRRSSTATTFAWGRNTHGQLGVCLLYTSPSPRDRQKSRMPSSA